MVGGRLSEPTVTPVYIPLSADALIRLLYTSKKDINQTLEKPLYYLGIPTGLNLPALSTLSFILRLPEI